MKVHAGEVMCLLGDNGAGKSTLIKTLSGVHQPTEGEILIDGKPVAMRSPRDALDRGIATVYQDLAMIPLMSITRNFFMGREPGRGKGPLGGFDVGEANRTARGRDGQDRDRRARPEPGGRHAVGRRAPVRRDRARGLLRRARPDPRRADLGARRQAGLGRAALRRPGARARPRRDLHHPQRPSRLPGRRRLHHPQPRPHLRHLPEEPTCRARRCST